MVSPSRLAFTSVLVGFAFAGAVQAQCEIDKFTGDPNLFGLGWNAALDGDFAALAEQSQPTVAVRFFRRTSTGWIPDGASAVSVTTFLGFGDVALDGDLAAVGVAAASTFAIQEGVVGVYNRSSGTWVSDGPDLVGDLGLGHRFGESVALEGETLVVGATREADGMDRNGVVHVYERSGGTWPEVARFSASDGVPGEINRYGFSVDIDGDTILVGAPRADGSAGAAYVYERSPAGWSETARLSGSGTANQLFGQNVALAGDLAIVGAEGDAEVDVQAGAAYVFERSSNGWVETQKLLASDAAAGLQFGFRVEASPEYLIVGSTGSAGGDGAAYVFVRVGSTWREVSRLTGSGPGSSGALFSSGLSLDGSRLLVGAANDSELVMAGGAAYEFQLAAPTRASYCTSNVNSSGFAARIDQSGCGSIAEDDVELLAGPVPENVRGLFFFGADAAQLPFGSSTLCVRPPLRRLPAVTSGPLGWMRHTVDFDVAPATAITPGATWRFQALFRDRFAPAGIELSDGLELTLEP